MIPVRVVDHGLRPQLWMRAFDRGNNIPRLDLADLGGRSDAEAQWQVDGLKAARIGGPQQFLHARADHFRDFFTSLRRPPTRECPNWGAPAKPHLLTLPSPRLAQPIP